MRKTNQVTCLACLEAAGGNHGIFRKPTRAPEEAHAVLGLDLTDPQF